MLTLEELHALDGYLLYCLQGEEGNPEHDLGRSAHAKIQAAIPFWSRRERHTRGEAVGHPEHPHDFERGGGWSIWDRPKAAPHEVGKGRMSCRCKRCGIVYEWDWEQPCPLHPERKE